MPLGPTKVYARSLQRAIEQVKGVTSARVVLDAAGDVDEIHVVGSARREAKRIVRDIESLLYAQFGLRVDYRSISVVQLDGPGVSAVPSRLRFVEAAPDPDQCDTIRVCLQTEGRTFRGRAPVQANAADALPVSAVANATLDALRQAIGNVAQLTLGDAQSIESGEQQVALVILQAVTPQGAECLTGTCVVRDSALAAAAKATLDAVNRRLPVWFLQAHNNALAEQQARGGEPVRAG